MLRQSRRIFRNRTIKQYTSIESLFNRLLRDIIFPQRIKIRAGQILPKIVFFFMANFRVARRLCDVIALSQGPRCAIRKFALERAFLNKTLSVVPGYIGNLVYEPHDGETRLDILHTKIRILRELSPSHSKSHNLNFEFSFISVFTSIIKLQMF